MIHEMSKILPASSRYVEDFFVGFQTCDPIPEPEDLFIAKVVEQTIIFDATMTVFTQNQSRILGLQIFLDISGLSCRRPTIQLNRI